MIRAFVSFLFAGIVMAPQVAEACVYIQRPEEVGHASGQYFAKEMLAAATYADLVIVEDDGVRGGGERATGILTLRSIARFKGNSADRFTVFGTGLTGSSRSEELLEEPLLHFTSETGQVHPFPFKEERPSLLFSGAGSDGMAPPPPPPMTSCGPPLLAAATGQFFVVLRDAEGRVLNRLILSDGKSSEPRPAFGFVPVSLTMDDFWLYSIRLAAEGGNRESAVPLLHLTSNTDSTRVEREVAAAGGTIRAAYYARGNFIEEVRPSPGEQAGSWVAKATSYLMDSRRGSIGDPHHSAAEFLRRKLSPMQRYGSGLDYEVAQAFTKSVRATQEANGVAQLVAIEVVGDPGAFASSSFVRHIGPLEVEIDRLPQVSGQDDAEIFATMQRIDRDIWLLNGGGGNQQGTLP